MIVFRVFMVGFLASGIWKKAPFLRLLIPVIPGILIQDILPISKWVSITVMSAGLIFLCFSMPGSPRLAFRFPWISGFLIHIVLFATGCQLLLVNRDRPLAERSDSSRTQTLILEVRSAPVRKKQVFSCEAILHWSVVRGRCFREQERLLLYFKDSGVAVSWEPGSLWLLNTKLSPVGHQSLLPTGRIRAFDYVTWCARKHIYSRVFVSARNCRQLSRASSRSARKLLSDWQQQFRLVCRAYVPGNAQAGLLEALLIGYTRDLDPDVLRAYSDAGVVHIIAISGLHLALIGELLEWLLLRLGPARTSRAVQFLLLLTAIWGYSLLTGGSPSVLRSALMFTFFVVARHFALSAPMVNALAASAFLLICDDPFRLWDTGFQLSYAAVLGLVLFATPIRAWLNPRNKMLAVIWKAASVSLAAQVLTTPVSIWYFHRFPFYFLLTNLVAVPLSSAILLGGIALLAVSAFPGIAGLVGLTLNFALKLMNAFVAYSNRLPGSALTEIPILPLQVILCYSMLYAGCRYSEKAEKRWLFSLLIQLCVFLAAGLNN